MKKELDIKIVLIISIVGIMSLAGLSLSVFNVIKWKTDNNKTNNIQKTIKHNIKVEDPVIDDDKSVLDNYNVNFDK